MVDHGGQLQIRHINVVDGVAANGGSIF